MRALLWPAIALAAACGGSISVEGHACPCTTNYVCCGGTNQCVGVGAACPQGSTGIAPTAENIRTLCNAPHGNTLGPPVTAQAFAKLLSRRWLPCFYDAKSVSNLVSHEGIEFHDDSTYDFLQSAPDGYEAAKDPKTNGYLFKNDTLLPTGDGYVTASDTTVAKELLLEFRYGAGNLELQVDFEHSPLRFHTWNGIDLWFVALDDDGTQYSGTEGMACDTAGAVCHSPTRCVSENNAGECAAPATVGKGEGCDHKNTRNCDTSKNLVCLTTRRCAEQHDTVGANCNDVLDVCKSPLLCTDAHVCAM